MSSLARLLLGSGVMEEVMALAGRRPVDEEEKMNVDYHGKGSQLCYYLPLLYVCTSSQYQNEQQRTTSFVTAA